MRGAGRVDGVNRHLDSAIGAIFEADWARHAGSQLTVHLRFGRTCADGPSTHQICQVLRGDHINELASSWQAAIVDSQQQFTRKTQAIVDMEAVIHLRIVN